MKSLSVVLFLLAACHLALAKDAPLPRAKPPSSRAAYPPSPAPVPEVLPLHDAEAWPSDCALRLAEIARFAHQPSVNGPGQCGASDVVRLEGIMMPNSALITVMPAATLRCPIAGSRYGCGTISALIGACCVSDGSTIAMSSDLGPRRRKFAATVTPAVPHSENVGPAGD